jgi:hypothetical protein
MGWPIDTAFTTFVNDPGSPSNPGASDANRWSQGIASMANRPLTYLSRTTSLDPIYPSGLTVNRVLWDQIQQQTDPAMTHSNSTGTPGVTPGYASDRIYLPYPGEVEFNVILRTQTNNTVGYAQLSVSVSFDSTYPNSIQDTDTAANDTRFAQVLRCRRTIVVGAAQVTAGVALVVDYFQVSGGANTLSIQYPAYPLFQVRYVGKGGQA